MAKGNETLINHLIFSSSSEGNDIKIIISSDVNDIDKTVDLIGTPHYSEVREKLTYAINNELLFSNRKHDDIEFDANSFN